MHHGNVKWFDNTRGIGSIQPVDGDDIQVDIAALKKSGIQSLKEGQLVVYDLAVRRGRTVAEDLKVL